MSRRARQDMVTQGSAALLRWLSKLMTGICLALVACALLWGLQVIAGRRREANSTAAAQAVSISGLVSTRNSPRESGALPSASSPASSCSTGFQNSPVIRREPPKVRSAGPQPRFGEHVPFADPGF